MRMNLGLKAASKAFVVFGAVSGLFGSISTQNVHAQILEELEGPGLLASLSYVPSGIAELPLTQGVLTKEIALELPIKRITNGVISVGGSVNGLLNTASFQTRAQEGSLFTSATFFGPNRRLLKLKAGAYLSPFEEGLRLSARFDQGFDAGFVSVKATADYGELVYSPFQLINSAPRNPFGPPLPPNAFRRYSFDGKLRLDALPIFVADSFVELNTKATTQIGAQAFTSVSWDVEGKLNLPARWANGLASLDFEHEGNSSGFDRTEADLEVPLIQESKYQVAGIASGSLSHSGGFLFRSWRRDLGLKLTYIPAPTTLISAYAKLGQDSVLIDPFYEFGGNLRYKFLGRRLNPELFAEASLEINENGRSAFGEAGIRLNNDRLQLSLSGTVRKTFLENAFFGDIPATFGLESEVTYLLGSQRNSKLYFKSDLTRVAQAWGGEVEAGLQFLF